MDSVLKKGTIVREQGNELSIQVTRDDFKDVCL